MNEENKENLNQNAVQNRNPYDLVDHPQDNSGSQNSVKKESGQFLKKIVKTIAKIAWLPDPETWEPAKAATEEAKPSNNDSVNPGTTLEQDVVAQEKQQEEKKQEEEKKKFSFESVMSGVTWVLDKIGKKVEEKTWIDLDAPLKKREDELNIEMPTVNTAEWQPVSESENTENKN